MDLKQENALRELNAALQKATECGLFDVNAGGHHPDVINNFCDAISETVKNTDFADRSHLLKDWTVRYGESGLKFECQAEDIKHAIEQCENAYGPNDEVLATLTEERGECIDSGYVDFFLGPNCRPAVYKTYLVEKLANGKNGILHDNPKALAADYPKWVEFLGNWVSRHEKKECAAHA